MKHSLSTGPPNGGYTNYEEWCSPDGSSEVIKPVDGDIDDGSFI